MTEKNKIVKRWIQKAEADLKTAKILIKHEDAPVESICFHAQQAVEKLLKAYLTYIDVKAGKTHDIAALLEICIEKDRDFEQLDMDGLEELTFYAVEIRYPESFYTPSVEEADKAIKLAEQARDFIMSKLGGIIDER